MLSQSIPFLALVCCGALIACDRPPESAPAVPSSPTVSANPVAPPSPPLLPAVPAAEDPATWTTYRSERLGFQVRMVPPTADSPEWVARDLEDDGEAHLVSQPDGRTGPWFILSVREIDRAPSRRAVERFLRDQIHVGVDPLGDAAYLGGGPMHEEGGRFSYSETWLVTGFDGFSMVGGVNVRVILAGNRLFVMEVREHNGHPTPAVVDAFMSSLEITERVAPAGGPTR